MYFHILRPSVTTICPLVSTLLTHVCPCLKPIRIHNTPSCGHIIGALGSQSCPQQKSTNGHARLWTPTTFREGPCLSATAHGAPGMCVEFHALGPSSGQTYGVLRPCWRTVRPHASRHGHTTLCAPTRHMWIHVGHSDTPTRQHGRMWMQVDTRV